ncbi:hypothetical protein [Glaesserella sp.]|uniref:hypothetical protein n=1 Tax=Glaesserella sp. TaxID=2094731 RepID=UPI00359F7D55
MVFFALTNSLWFVIPFILAWIPYTAVSAAAVSGAAFTAFGLFVYFALYIHSIDDPKGGGALWLIYLFWMVGSFIAALFPAMSCPVFFIKTAKRAFISACVFTLVAGFLMGFLVSNLF